MLLLLEALIRGKSDGFRCLLHANKTTQFSVGSTVGQDSTMFNVGASFKVGSAGESVKPQDSSEVRALAKEVETLKAQHEADVNRIAALESKVNALSK